jgi:hypothetical protein
MILSLFLLVTSISLAVGLYHSVKKNLELIDTLEETSAVVETCLEDLNYCYKRVDKKLKLELLSDDPVVKELVEDMKVARRAIANISERLTNEKVNFEPDEASAQDASR